MSDPLLALHALAADAGIRTAYRDTRGCLRVASADALLAILRALGVDINSPAAADDARQALAADRPAVPPVVVAWEGRLATPIRLPVAAIGPAAATLVDETGETRHLNGHVFAAGGAACLRLNEPLPHGLLELHIATTGGDWQTFVISAPAAASVPPRRREWGLFAPLHAFGPAVDAPMTYRDLADAARQLRALGGTHLGTLPLLAAFLDEPFEPSPYAPASRLFWNELFVALDDDPPAAESGARAPIFEYKAAAARQRPRLQAAADAFFESDGTQSPDWRAFFASHPEVESYARFRAACDRFRSGFSAWPGPARSGDLSAVDLDPADVRRHLYGAWLADRQLAAVAASARADEAAALYIDLPLGVHDQGFDVWRWPDLFAAGVTAGAPPDALFRGGQNWGFRPLAPGPLRRSRYDYLARVLRHHMRHAGALRIDHVMSIVRLFWIPSGFPPTEGVYVSYPREEILALLVLESCRHDTRLVGEDLGTVPEEVRTAMDLRGLLRMFVMQFALGGHSIPQAPRHVVASLNTHDTPTFAGFWAGTDIDDQRQLGLLDDARASASNADRARLRRRVASALDTEVDDVAAVLRGLLDHLARGPSDILLVTLEDLWGETLPQNVPGTHGERPNWRRRARFGIRQALRNPDVLRLLRDLDQLRCAETPDAR